MMRRALLLVCCWLGGLLAVHAALADSLRQRLPSLHGKARLQAYGKLYRLSQGGSDQQYTLRCLNDYINELDRQNEKDTLALALVERVTFFYNYDLTDSVYKYAPQALDRLKGLKTWNKYYEVWMTLCNTYVFSGKYNMALREVQTMFDDAKERNNKYGMGIAYYMMGNVYSNMHNHKESVSSYRKGIDLLLTVDDKPSTIADLYSYLGDELDEMKEYEKLQKLTVEWKAFLDGYFAEKEVKKNSIHPYVRNVLESYYYLACAQAALGLNQLDEAEKMLNEVHRRIPSEEDYVGQSWLYYKAKLHLQRKDYRTALELNNRRYQLSDNSDMAMLVPVLTQRGEILEALGRYQDASSVYKNLIQVKDSVSGVETRNQLNEMNTLFQVDELKMEQARAQFRNTLIIIGLIVTALVIFLIFRMIAARRLKKAHQELLVAYDQLEETTTAKERIESDLRIARNIQMGMVPHTFPEREDVDLYASMTPAKEVGGDLYGYLLIPAKEEGQGDKLYFALGDVSGKGVPASLFMAQATRLFLTLAKQQMMPAEICDHLNDALSGEDNETGMFVTMFVGLVDLQTGHLDFCNAGHNPPVLVGDGTTEFIEMEPNAPIGLWPGLEYVGEEIKDISNRPLFVYTDGLNEAENRQQEQFSDERLLEILQTTPFESSQQTIEMLREQVEAHRDGAEPNDDLTMLCVRVIK
jgi:serine phosphatase RsbU (regulator of sigma subunit)